MTVKEAFATNRQLILTIDPPDGSPPYKTTMVHPYCLFADGSILGEMVDGVDSLIYEEFISEVELGEEIV